MKNVKKMLAFLKVDKTRFPFHKTVILAVFAMTSIDTNAQLVSSLTINTGYSSSSGSLVAINGRDPNWDIVQVGAPLNAGPSPLPYDGWISAGWTSALASTRWVTYDPLGGAGRMTATGAEYDNIGAILTLQRNFEICGDDEIQIVATIKGDNQINSVTIDGNPVILSGSPLAGSASINHTQFLTAGVHTIEIEIQNYITDLPTNAIGLSLSGSVSSIIGTQSIVDREAYPDYECLGCEPPCSDCRNTNILPKVTDPNTGDMTCSQIYDDGTSVGINKTSGFSYTSGGVFTAGAPGSQLVRLDISGLTRSVSFVATSDKKYKQNIVSLEHSIEKVMQLRPVEYDWKVDKYKEKGFDHLKHTGFIAQELAEVLPNSVIKDNNGDFAVDYNSIIPVLTQAIQEQQAIITELRNEIEALKVGTKVDTKTITPHKSSLLEQNTPNPFTEKTIIKYDVVSMQHSAGIHIYNINGEQLATHNINNVGIGEVIINGGEMQAGTYLFSLFIDGIEVDTKKMILSK